MEQNRTKPFIFILLIVWNNRQMRPRSFLARSNVWDYVVRCAVCRNYGKVLMESAKLSDNIRVTESWLNAFVVGHHRSIKSILKECRLQQPLSEPTVCHSHWASMIIPYFWCHGNETGSLYVGLSTNDLSVFDFILNWDHLSQHDHTENTKTPNQSNHDYGCLFAADLLCNWTF